MKNDKEFYKVNPIINYNARKWCTLPYYLHPKGCPNFNKLDKCPPKAALFDEEFDINKTIYLLYYKFNLGKHMRKLKKKFPHWSIYQLRCVLYWQPKARKEFRQYVNAFLKKHPNYSISMCPEGQGVDLVSTMKQIGIKIIFPPKNITYLVALAAIRK